MEKINRLLSSPQQIVEQASQPKPTTTTGQLTSEQRDSVAYFFLRMANVYGSKYHQQWPNEEAIKLAKREWAEQIGKFSRGQIDAMFANAKAMLIAGDDEWRWPEIGRILSGVVETWERRAHRPFERVGLPNLTKKERAKQAGAQALASMKSLWGKSL